MKENLKNRREAAKNMRAAEEAPVEETKGITVESMSTAS